MMVRHFTRATMRGPMRHAGRFVRLLSLVLISTIGIGIVQAASDSVLEDDADRDERIVFRHFV